jgi:hypothetical protein
MTQFKYLTVVYRYVDSDEFKTFFKEQVADRNCAYKANENKLIQTTSWFDGDAIQQLQEPYNSCACPVCVKLSAKP